MIGIITLIIFLIWFLVKGINPPNPSDHPQRDWTRKDFERYERWKNRENNK